MDLKEDDLDQIVERVDDLSSRVRLLKDHTAKLAHYWELECVRRSFAEFKWRFEQLQRDDDLRFKRDCQVIENTWNQLTQARDALLVPLLVALLAGNTKLQADGGHPRR